MARRILAAFSVLAFALFSAGAKADVIQDQVGVVAADFSTGAALAGTLTGGYITTDWSWTHTYGPIAGSIVSASIAVDLLDGDNGPANLYAANGTFIGELTNRADHGVGSPAWYDLSPQSPPAVCSIASATSCDNLLSLPASLFSDLADGSFGLLIDVPANLNTVGRWGSNRALLTIEFAPLAIPEPQTYALLLAGLGLMGWAGRRRKQQK